MASCGPGLETPASDSSGSSVPSQTPAPSEPTAPAPTAALEVFSISPTGGALGGGTSVTISGAGFKAGATVKLGGSVCATPQVISSTQITCTTSVHVAGSANVVVTNPDLSLSPEVVLYTYRAAPGFGSFFPAEGPVTGGTLLTLNGTGFIDGASVMIDGVSCASAVVVSATQMTCTTPAHAVGSVAIYIRNPDQQTSPLINFEYQAPPVITNVSPSSGGTAGGTSITITGTDFRGSSVTLDGISCSSVMVVSPTQITCVTPPHAPATVLLVVENSDGQVSPAFGGFTYRAAPVISGITPNAGSVMGGTSVTISGLNFVNGATADFAGSSCDSLTVVNSNQITCTTTAHAAGIIGVTVTNPDGQVSVPYAGYTYQPAPSVTGVSPNVGALAGGTNITITGTGFLSGASVMVGGVTCGSQNVVNSTTLTCWTSAHAAATVDILVVNSDSQYDIGTNLFTYQAAAHTQSVSPSVGPTAGGTVLTITGTDFIAGATVDIGGAPCTSPSVVNSTTLTCTTSASTDTHQLVFVTNPDLQTPSSAAFFQYRDIATVSSVSPNSGTPLGGTFITITGTDFRSASAVDVDGTPCVGTTIVSSTTITCTTPSHAVAVVDISVTDPEGYVGSGVNIYTYLPAPTLSGVSPHAGPLAGGTPLSITGSNFIIGANVTLNGVACNGINFVDSNNINCTTPAQTAGLTNLIVTNPDGQATTSVPYTYQEAPTVSGVTPNTGSTLGNDFVTVTGSGFVVGITVTFGGNSCTSVNVVNSTSLTCTTPAHAFGVVDIVAMNLDSQVGMGVGLFDYNIRATNWTEMSTLGAPSSRKNHSAVWSGSKMFIFGGADASLSNSGGVYDPTTDSWSSISTLDAPIARQRHSAVWLANQMFIFGGEAGSAVNTGGLYDPVTDRWTGSSTVLAPSRRKNHTAVWTGQKVFVYGGSNGVACFNDGALYDPFADEWNGISTLAAPRPRENHTATWTGNQSVIFGGEDGGTFLNSGGIYDPNANDWLATSTIGAPEVRTTHTSVWTGNKMLVFGGFANAVVNTGGVYDPLSDHWSLMTTTSAPSARNSHTAVWAGDKMIIFGGSNGASLNSGGRYDPFSDSWASISSASERRHLHSAVWTGSSMLVFGGEVSGVTKNSGSQYNP